MEHTSESPFHFILVLRGRVLVRQILRRGWSETIMWLVGLDFLVWQLSSRTTLSCSVKLQCRCPFRKYMFSGETARSASYLCKKRNWNCKKIEPWTSRNVQRKRTTVTAIAIMKQNKPWSCRGRLWVFPLHRSCFYIRVTDDALFPPLVITPFP